MEDLQFWALLLMLLGIWWDGQRNVRRVLEGQQTLINKQQSDGLELRRLTEEVASLESRVRELGA